MFEKRRIGFSLAGFALLVLAADLSSGCGSDSDVVGETGTGASAGSAADGGSGGTTASGGSGGSGGEFGSGGSTTSSGGQGAGTPTEIAECQGHVYECGDLIDNDGDGLIDSQDPDCLGPCDNTEDSLHGGIPGQNQSPCTQDCYFDQDTGPGNDKCYWSHWCDPLSVDPNYYPEPKNGATCEYDPNKQVNGDGGPWSCQELQDAQKQQCYDYCGPLTPNGCDCFGCCEIPPGTDNFVWLGSEGEDGNTECTLDKVNDPDVCHPCTPVKSCLNDCKKCELCVGKTSLPEECFGGEGGSGGTSGSGGSGGSGGNTEQCPDGVQACGLPGQDPCPSGYSCITGCCYEAPE